MLANKLIVLDTHIWIWLLSGDQRIQKIKSLKIIEEAAKYSQIRLAAISVWETAMLEAKGRLQFAVSCMDWIKQALAMPGLQLVGLAPEIAVESSCLPGKFHGDPADRIIVATARKLNAVLITQDKEILLYGKQNYVHVVN